jgi:Thermolysin metallopeptidase, catalytic domain
MNTLPHVVCGVIPPHMLKRVAGQTTIEASENARATLEHMRELATGRAPTLLAPQEEAPPRDERRRVYDARHRFELPGQLVITSKELSTPDVEALEAWYGSGVTYDFFRRVFGRRSIDGQDMRLDATVHYGTGFENAMWNGRQMVYGDGDGKIFKRFTPPPSRSSPTSSRTASRSTRPLSATPARPAPSTSTSPIRSRDHRDRRPAVRPRFRDPDGRHRGVAAGGPAVFRGAGGCSAVRPSSTTNIHEENTL